MNIGVIKEIKNRENRVALTPGGCAALIKAGHAVRVERGAGEGSGFSDADYAQSGAGITSTAEAWDSDLVLKIKEPLEPEYGCLAQQIVFTYFHLAGAPRALTETLLERGTSAVAYETVEDAHGRLPLLAPMSAVAGNMSVTIGAYYLARFNGGRGVQLGSVLGTRHGKAVVIGDGVVGQHAARVASGMGSEVFILGRHADREAQLKAEISQTLEFVLSTPENVAHHVQDADLVVGGVLLPGARAPRVVTEDMVSSMPRGSVIVDVSIDQGGCVETSRPTSHGPLRLTSSMASHASSVSS